MASALSFAALIAAISGPQAASTRSASPAAWGSFVRSPLQLARLSGKSFEYGNVSAGQLASLLDRWRSRPMLLRKGVCPCRSKWLEYETSLRELAILDPVNLHSCPRARLAGFWIGPFELKPKPRAVPLECVIIHNDPYVGSLLPRLSNLSRVSLACHGPVACFVVPDVVRLDAPGD